MDIIKFMKSLIFKSRNVKTSSEKESPRRLINDKFYEELPDGSIRIKHGHDTVDSLGNVNSSYWEGKPFSDFVGHCKSLEKARQEYNKNKLINGTLRACLHGHMFNDMSWKCDCGEYLLDYNNKLFNGIAEKCPNMTDQRARANYNGETKFGRSVNFLNEIEVKALRERYKTC